MNKDIKEKLISMIPEIAKTAYPIFKEKGWKYFYSTGDCSTQKEIERCLLGLVNSHWELIDDNVLTELDYWSCGRFSVYRTGKVLLRNRSDEEPEMEWSIEKTLPTLGNGLLI